MAVPKKLLKIASMNEPTLAQGPFSWKPNSWYRKFPAPETGAHDLNHEAISELEKNSDSVSPTELPQIGRKSVTELAAPSTLSREGGSYDPQRVVAVFLASMIWGYGMVGYGPYRAKRVLDHGGDDPEDSALTQLVEVAEIAQRTQDGGLKAFKHIADQRRTGRSYLKYLGPAFGTKFIYFLTKASEEVKTAPVMDSVVAGWIQRNAPEMKPLNITWWDTDSYRRYAGALQKWATELSRTPKGQDLEADDVELLIFQDARGISPADAGSENVTVESMLEDLGTEAETRGGDVDKVGIRLVEALREWFAKYPSMDDTTESDE